MITACAMQAALEAALSGQLRGGALAGPLQEAFSSAFQRTLVPAFEAACQSMFAQASFRISIARYHVTCHRVLQCAIASGCAWALSCIPRGCLAGLPNRLLSEGGRCTCVQVHHMLLCSWIACTQCLQPRRLLCLDLFPMSSRPAFFARCGRFLACLWGNFADTHA